MINVNTCEETLKQVLEVLKKVDRYNYGTFDGGLNLHIHGAWLAYDDVTEAIEGMRK